MGRMLVKRPLCEAVVGAGMAQRKRNHGMMGIGHVGQCRLLHAMVRVRELERSLDFYCGRMGMKVLRTRDYPDGKFTNTFVGYGSEAENAVIELTYNWGRVEPYELGTGFGHLAIGVSDIYAVCERLSQAGVKITRAPGPMKHGTTVIAFIEDPDGYKIELIEAGSFGAGANPGAPAESASPAR